MRAEYPSATTSNDRNWLRTYAFVRAAVSAAWVGSAFTLGKSLPVAEGLLVAYPAWDALANLIDARRNGGFKASPSQAVNAAVSTLTAIGVVVALGTSLNAVVGVFGAWAVLAGLLQLITGVRRWKAGGQWPMVLSGGQSALAGAYFVKLALGKAPVGIADVAPYAAFGAIYFAISGLWLTFAGRRKV